MSDMIDNSKKPIPETDVPGPADAGRRRLLQGGLGVAPVVLTLASRSTFGDTSTGQCTTPSGFVSGNTSKPGGSTGCGGQSPGYWKNIDKHSWPSPFAPDNFFYSSGFVSGMTINYKTLLGIANPTMMDVMTAQGFQDPSKIGFHVIGALLNQAAGMLPPYITQSMLYALFNDVATQGYYLPVSSMPSIKWYAADVVTYLMNTGIAS